MLTEFIGKIIIFFILSFNLPPLSPILLFYICRKISHRATEKTKVSLGHKVRKARVKAIFLFVFFKLQII